MQNTALVVGATGLSGSNLAEKLIKKGWKTYGLSRNPNTDIKGLIPVQANLLNLDELKIALQDVAPTHVFFTTWMRNDTEEENIRVNSAMVRNLLKVIAPKKSLQHTALVTGLKHYLGPFDAYANGAMMPLIPVREEHPRLSIDNFYYAQEDEILEAAKRDGFTWSIHRPHTLIGNAIGNAMNMGTTLAVYATICKEYDKPFVWPGSEAQWNGVSDVTDVEVLAEQMIWAATVKEAQNKAFNVANGDVFRWNWMWYQIANYFKVNAEGYNDTIRPLEQEIAQYTSDWERITEKHDLKIKDLAKLASAWHTDLDLSRPIEVITDMEASRKIGFTSYKSSRDSFFELFDKLKSNSIIP